MATEIKLQPELAKAVEELGFTEWTEIQEKTIPLIQQGKDLIGQSFTGSGKTAAFGLPLLEKVIYGEGLQAMILVPTRELCEQVTKEMLKFSKHKRARIVAVYGGVSINPQITHLRNAEIMVGTPGRVLDHLMRGTLQLHKIHTLVLDEADRMFDMGFIDDVKQIVSRTPQHRQTLLFSATISAEVREIVKHYMRNPVNVAVQSYVDEGKLLQYYYDVDAKDKFSLLVHLLRNFTGGLTIIFCATRRRVDVVSKNLYKQEIRSLALHGGLTQQRRKQAMDMFHGNEADILVASDVAARGLDIKHVSHIINYDIPKTSKDYVHRIGRTARAGSEGSVISLLSHQDYENFRNVLADRSLIVQKLELPEFRKVIFDAREQRPFGQRREGFRGGQSRDGFRGRQGGGSRGRGGQGGYRGRQGPRRQHQGYRRK